MEPEDPQSRPSREVRPPPHLCDDDVDYLPMTESQSHLTPGEVLPADVQQVLVVKEEVLDQEDPEPPHIKEEPEELWTSQEGEQLQGLEEADITKFPFTPVPVKSEDDEEKPQSSQLHRRLTEQMETAADGEDTGGPEPDRNSDPESVGKTGDTSEPDTDDSDDWKESRKPQSGLNSLNIDDYIAGVKTYSCSECGKIWWRKSDLKVHMRYHTGERPFSCSVCKKSFVQSGRLKAHMRTHTGEKPFTCSICGKTFNESVNLRRHTLTHVGKKPFTCSFCGKGFIQKVQLTSHMTHHTGEKPFSCSVCSKAFRESGTLRKHMRVHTGEKPFSCDVCGKSFAWRPQLKAHKCVDDQSSQLHQTQPEENRVAEPPASSSAVQIPLNAIQIVFI